MKPSNVRIVVSGSAWIGGNQGSVESALYRLFAQARDEVTIVAYSISGATTMLFERLDMLLQRGIRTRMIINRFADQPQNVQHRLQQLLRTYPGLLQLISFDPENEQADLHAKIVVVDRQQALVGSANLSMRGLHNNHELGVVVDGAAAIDIARAIDALVASPYAHPI